MLQAYYEMADFLTTQGAISTSKHISLEPPEEVEVNLYRPIKKLKGLVQAATLTEQVQSLMSFCASVEDQLCTAYQMVQEWSPPIPACVSDLYRQ